MNDIIWEAPPGLADSVDSDQWEKLAVGLRARRRTWGVIYQRSAPDMPSAADIALLLGGGDIPAFADPADAWDIRHLDARVYARWMGLARPVAGPAAPPALTGKAAQQARLYVVGALLALFRHRHDVTGPEAAVLAGGLSGSSWYRMERGLPGRPDLNRTVEALLGLEEGAFTEWPLDRLAGHAATLILS